MTELGSVQSVFEIRMRQARWIDIWRALPAIPLPARVLALLGLGLALGLVAPRNAAVRAIYLSGTYLPRFIVTLAALLIFHLLAGAMAKLILQHKDRAGRLFQRILVLYVVMGVVSLIYALGWLAVVSGLPISLPGTHLPTPLEWSMQIGNTLLSVLSQQPLLQTLAGGMVAGWLTASIPALHGAAHALIKAGDLILTAFRNILWYYPIMIGCLAIGIPLKFGHKGLAVYGQCVLWDGVVIGVWCVGMIIIGKAATKRSWKQILSYYGTVWPTGFGTGGSYETLAVNLISAEKDLGLKPEVADISIVFGTVLNKNCATMSVLIVTVGVARLLSIPISLFELALLIPPVAILGLETPGIPGGAGYFMSPILAVLLHVPNPALWVTTFVGMYSGLIPMFSTAGNTTDDGIVGALLEDRFMKTPAQKSNPQEEPAA